jgi:hypothetical protein
MNRVGVHELEIWTSYRKKYGPLNHSRHIDIGSANVASIIARANGGKGSIEDYMIFGREPEPDIEVNEEQFIAMLEKRKK